VKCLIEECDYEGKHDGDIAEHANLKHGAFFRRGREGAEYVYLVAPRGQSIQFTHYVGDACPGGHAE